MINFKVIVANVLSVVVLAFLLEGLVYMGLSHPNRIPGVFVPHFRNYYLTRDREIIQITDCARYDSVLFYIMSPGKCEFNNREFRTTNSFNSVGLRDDENSLHKPRAIFLGDSYTMGWGVMQNESFPQLLEKKTGSVMLNAGMSSYGTARELTLLDRIPLDGVEYIFIQYHPNDYTENHTFVMNNYKLPVRDKYSYDSLKNARGTNPDYYPFKHLYGFTRTLGARVKSVWTKEPKVEATDYEQALTFLKVLKAHQEKLKPVRVFVFELAGWEVQNNKFESALDSLANTDDFDDLKITTIKRANFKEDHFFILDDHLNSSGHEMISTMLFEEVFSSN
jgi:hypothetical protein